MVDPSEEAASPGEAIAVGLSRSQSATVCAWIAGGQGVPDFLVGQTF
jgi:hypothetical protein